MTRLLSAEEEQIERERLFSAVIESLDADCGPAARHELKVKLAASEPMSWCPPGVEERHWRKLRSLAGDPNMRRRLWSALVDLDARRTQAHE